MLVMSCACLLRRCRRRNSLAKIRLGLSFLLLLLQLFLRKGSLWLLLAVWYSAVEVDCGEEAAEAARTRGSCGRADFSKLVEDVARNVMGMFPEVTSMELLTFNQIMCIDQNNDDLLGCVIVPLLILQYDWWPWPTTAKTIKGKWMMAIKKKKWVMMMARQWWRPLIGWRSSAAPARTIYVPLGE